MNTRLKALRKALGLKQREIAARLEVTVGTIGQWEAGVTPLPRARIYQICKEYGVRRDYLEKGVGAMFERDALPKSEEEKLRESALALFNALTPKGKAAVLDALAEIVGKESGSAAGSKSISISDSTVDGDVIQL